MTFSIVTIVNNCLCKIRIKCSRIYNRLLREHIILIHTPKCAGSYINKHYMINQSKSIQSVGHAQFRSLKLYPKTRIVGLIREPIDWYKSYYYFCVESLSKAPQNNSNFPDQHPISIYSDNAQLTLEQMIHNMADKKFLKHIHDEGLKACIYNRYIDGVFDFMKRTNTGFWTWTMMYHFSTRKLSELLTKNDILCEAQKITTYVQFIHQEDVDSGVERYLKLPIDKGERINVSLLPCDMIITREMRKIVKQLDGKIAYILGKYT